MSNGESTLEFQLKAYKIEYVREYRFHPERRWRADFYLPQHNVLVEIEGGTWVNGAHNRPKHYESDCIKYNAATLAGYRVLRYTTDMVKSGAAIEQIRWIA